MRIGGEKDIVYLLSIAKLFFGRRKGIGDLGSEGSPHLLISWLKEEALLWTT